MKINRNIQTLLLAGTASFGAYFSMYAFRKPFTVAAFEGIRYWGIDYKILLVLAQVFGYMLSKFLGIKIISEMKASNRIYYLIGFILIAELSLLGFAVTRAPYNTIFLFFNGLPLGMVWGVVFSYLEGRKATEVLGVVLCSSFILSSGMVKSAGKWVMDSLQVNAYFMPFVTGLFFILPLVFFAILLERIPSPSEEDIASRSLRKPMNRQGRWALYKRFAFPLTLIAIYYVFLTGVRDFRDNFAREIWDTLGFQDSVGIYSYSEIPIAIAVLIIMIFIGSVTKNYKAFRYYHYAILTGGILTGLSTFFFQTGTVNAVFWMIVSGFGLFLGYIPFQGLFFDRMIATFKISGNVGFLIYIADAFGYLGSVMILLYKNFDKGQLSYFSFYISLVYVVAIFSIVIAIVSFLFFRREYYKRKADFFVAEPELNRT